MRDFIPPRGACLSLWIHGLLGLTLAGAALAADPFAEGVRTTEPLDPDAEQKAFRLPPGFEIQLVASEPDILKPMNLAFDARGRLWVTVTREYPYPVPLNRTGRDQVKILSDFDATGRARSIDTFAEGLNIPIGILPVKQGAIVWSIPNIWLMEDTDDDGRADRKTRLYGPLGWERDTHGNNASFRRGFDGWLYATHGFNNNTTLRGADGSVIEMNSGNTYRVRLDGTRAEQHTWGQVNPFGLTFDAQGNLYSADCHSAPIYQLLRGAYYPSFGKPDDGLGFAPLLMQHSHGSTAIAGIAHTDSAWHWPTEFRDNLFVGNVMTSRLNRDQLSFKGSSPRATELPDFLATEDPWFRPVDSVFGPDGALYVADFYNRIIGHYEVRLDHPGRDRTRGRIWRIVYRETGGNRRDLPPLALATGVRGLIAELSSPLLNRRMLATHELVDRHGAEAVSALRREFARSGLSPVARVHVAWALQRLGALDASALSRLAADNDPTVRVHLHRILSETAPWHELEQRLALAGLADASPAVQRSSAEALARAPRVAHVRPLLAARARVPDEDDHLVHALRIALRNQVRETNVLRELQSAAWTEAESRSLADVLVSVSTPEAASFLLAHLGRHTEPGDVTRRYLGHAARHLAAGELDSLATFARGKFASDTDLQLDLFGSVQSGLQQRGAKLPESVRTWGEALTTDLLATFDPARPGWHHRPVETMTRPGNPWFLQQRQSADGNSDSTFVCSLPPGGEALTGALWSPPFEVPATLEFWIAGHDGPPDRKAQGRNRVRLRSWPAGEVLAEAPPPRNDVAQRIRWDLASAAGRQARIEIVDGDTGEAYAWLAVGRFSSDRVRLPSVNPSRLAARWVTAADLARTLPVPTARESLLAQLRSEWLDLDVRAAAGRAIASMAKDDLGAGLAVLIADPALSAGLRSEIAGVLAGGTGIGPWIRNAFRGSPYAFGVRLAQTLASSTAGAQHLLGSVEEGVGSPQLLLDRTVKDRLGAADAGLSDRAAKLTEGVSPLNAEIQKKIDQRLGELHNATADMALGAQVFERTCAVCHQVGGKGSVVGPQLDGIGGRGLARLLEDVLDPNRNVDRAFRSQVIRTRDGEVYSGLPRREEGEILVLVDSTGKELQVRKADIDLRRDSETSLMPDNFVDVLKPEEFQALMSWLAAQRQ